MWWHANHSVDGIGGEVYDHQVLCKTPRYSVSGSLRSPRSASGALIRGESGALSRSETYQSVGKSPRSQSLVGCTPSAKHDLRSPRSRSITGAALASQDFAEDFNSYPLATENSRSVTVGELSGNDTPQSVGLRPRVPTSERLERGKQPHPPRSRLFNLWQATTLAPARTANPLPKARPNTQLSSVASRPGTSLTPCSRSGAGPTAVSSCSKGSSTLTPRGGIMESLARSACAAPNLAEEVDHEKGRVTVLPAQDQLLLTDNAVRYHRFQPATFDKRDLLYTDRFRDTCKRKYSTLCQAWRLLLDVDGVGRVAFVPFCSKARFIGFREPKRLWRVLNTHRTCFLTLDEWDPVAFRNLYEFRGICLKQFGGMDCAFNFGMDKTGSRTCTMPELERFCDDHDFSGNVKELFEALDMHRHGFITLDELEFLAKWEGESHLTRVFDFDFERLQVRKRKNMVQRAKIAALRTGELSTVGASCSVDADLLDNLLNEAECDL